MTTTKNEPTKTGRTPLDTLGLVSRAVEDGTHEGQPVRVIRAGRTYETDVEDLWDALTNPARIPRWFLPISGELKLGGRYQFKGNAGGTIHACERPSRLMATWEFGGKVSWV
ncbi:MAG: SRPBCC domain-containing protein, partial [Myxococcales bacterium]